MDSMLTAINQGSQFKLSLYMNGINAIAFSYLCEINYVLWFYFQEPTDKQF